MLCAIIGGGPAGLNAALILARARHHVIIFDQQQPRNAITEATHGFMTREGIAPQKLRKLAQQELEQFSHVKQIKATVTTVRKGEKGMFSVLTSQGMKVEVHKVLLATGLKETLPSVKNIARFYGSSIFSCAYCDGYEQRDEPLAIITEANNAVSLAATIQQWSKKLFLFTNGKVKLTGTEKQLLAAMNVSLYEQPIAQLVGQKGKLQGVQLLDGSKVHCRGGFVSTFWHHNGSLAQQLGCKLNERGGIWQDGHGRTSISGIYVAGDATNISPAQVTIAASDGVKAAISMNQDDTQQRLMRTAAQIRAKEHTQTQR